MNKILTVFYCTAPSRICAVNLRLNLIYLPLLFYMLLKYVRAGIEKRQIQLQILQLLSVNYFNYLCAKYQDTINE
jgi:hypothetical protein